MAAIGSLRRRLRESLASEQGMALPTALFALIATFALASVAILSSVDAQHGTLRDRNSKEAIAAADAGASIALLRLNRFKSNLKEATPCIGPGGEAVAPEAEGWCPATAPESVGGATFSYQVSAFQQNAELSVISVGTSGNVSRRVEVKLFAHDGDNVFAHEQAIGQDDVTLKGGPRIETDVGTNGDVVLENESGEAGEICGNIRRGVGKSSPEPDCDGEILEGSQDLPAIQLPEDLSTNNSNCRLEQNPTYEGLSNCASDPSQVDTYSKHRNATSPYEAETRQVHIGSQASLSMGGQDYFVCKLVINSGQLIMVAGPEVHIRIFVDTPENCGLSSSSPQVEMTGNSSIVSTAYNEAEESYAVPEIYVLGGTPVNLHGTSDANELILYAPDSDVTISGDATWTGLIAGKSLTFKGSTEMRKYPGEPPEGLSVSTLWQRTHYVECTGAEVSPPNADC